MNFENTTLIDISGLNPKPHKTEKPAGDLTGSTKIIDAVTTGGFFMSKKSAHITNTQSPLSDRQVEQARIKACNGEWIL